MPVYEYTNGRGERVDLVRTVEERDRAPRGFRRVTVPRRVAIHGSSSSPLDPEDADQAVPRALKQLEAKVPAREIVKDSGWNVNELKEIWGGHAKF